MNGCTALLNRMSRRSQLSGINRTILISSWSSITGSALMKGWDERRRGVFIVSLHAVTREKFHPLNTARPPRFGACAITARSNGVAISFTSRRCWLKSRLDSRRSRERSGRVDIDFICSVRSIHEEKRSCQLKTGIIITEKTVNHTPGLICKGCPTCTEEVGDLNGA